MLELNGSTLTFDEFRVKCLEPNQPAIIRNAAAATATASSPSFDVAALTARLSPRGLCELLGRQHRVPVYPVHSLSQPGRPAEADATQGSQEHTHGDEDECQEVAVEDVLRSWCVEIGSKANTRSRNGGSGRGPGERLFYLKDWHMQSDVETALAGRGPQEGAPCGFDPRVASARRHGFGLYQVPAFLGPDWMDPFVVEARHARRDERAGFGDGKHDYRFAYIGPPNTWTGLHHDVFGTYSWSFNVCGDKLWFFPDLEGNAYLRRTLVRGFPTPPDIRVLTGFRCETCVQHPGDLVFVPSGYFHQVHNISGRRFDYAPAAAAEATTQHPLPMELTIAVNHNWCNQFCIARMVEVFLRDVDTLLDLLDVRDLQLILGDANVQAWRDHVDFMLHGGCNWSFRSVLAFLDYCEGMFGQDEDGRVGPLLRALSELLTHRRDSMFTAPPS